LTTDEHERRMIQADPDLKKAYAVGFKAGQKEGIDYTKLLEKKIRERDAWIKKIRRQLGWWFTNPIEAVSPLEKAELEIRYLKEAERLKEQS